MIGGTSPEVFPVECEVPLTENDISPEERASCHEITQHPLLSCNTGRKPLQCEELVLEILLTPNGCSSMRVEVEMSYEVRLQGR